MNDPETQEAAVLQALMVRACDGVSQASERQLAKATGLSKSCVHRTLTRLRDSGQLSERDPGTPGPTMWEIPGQRSGPPLVQNESNTVRNAIPTMPFQLPAPLGQAGSWFEQVYRQLTRAYSDVASGRLIASCRKCADTGYYLVKVSEEYSRKWLRTCDCEAGQWKVIPEAEEYEPQSHLGLCLMCENTGWVQVGPNTVQRCYSCRRTWS